MLNPLDIELTIDSDRAVITYADGRNDQISVDLIDLVNAAAEILTASEMNTLYDRLDEATCLARRLSREMYAAQTTD